MFRFISTNVSKYIINQKTTNYSSIFRRKSNNTFKIACLTTLPLSYYFSNKIFCVNKNQQQKQCINVPLASINLIQNPKTKWQKIKSFINHFARFFQLIFIFLPPLLLFPLNFFKLSRNLWLKLFVNSVQRAGVVWIKAFQYLSHRRDVLGPQMAQAFTHLRQNAPQHSFQQTKQIFKKAYGKNIEEIFDKFDQIPIASASVSQVYKAVYKGRKVAVKVRHPDVDKHIQRDVNILFGISKFLSLFSKSYQIPVGEGSLKKTLVDQIDFNVEKDNLNIFNNHFKGNKCVKFPLAFQQQTRDSVLIQTFIEGVPVTYFQNNKHPLNAVIARLGATTFFEMLMKNNFIHADCHGGNILVQVSKQSPNFFDQIKQFIKQKYNKLEAILTESFLQNETLKSLYKASRQQQQNIRKMIRKCTQKVKITLIDVGMVIKLNQSDRLNFVNFIKSIIQGNSQTCANMIYNLSNFDGKKIIQGKFNNYKDQLKKLFSVLDNKSIFDIEGIQLLVGMMNIIRDNNMKLDGQFATLITNMVVLQSIAKQIDPNIQILKCAIPYFKFVQQLPINNKMIDYMNPVA